MAPKAAGAVASAPQATASSDPNFVKPTTAGNIAVGNLEAQLSSYRKLLDDPARRLIAYGGVVPLLAARAQFLGLVEDYEEADRYAERWVSQSAEDPAGYLARAGTRASLHRFDAALADLVKARALHAQVEEVDSAKAAILQAQGKTTRALSLVQSAVDRYPSIGNLGALGTLLAELGKSDAAEAAFAKAPTVYRDISPFPVAWTQFQRGQMWERLGQPSKAIASYRVAVDRLPAYATAQAHLAGLEAATGHRDAAIGRLGTVVAHATDPEFVGQLAGLLAESGKASEAAPLRAKAAAGFEALLARHPEAFADHAARFYLGPGGNPARALELATLNLENRQSSDAFDLGLAAALEANDPAAACAFAARAKGALPALPTPHLEFLVGKAAAGCAKPQ